MNKISALQTLLILGRNPAISIAEIRAKFPNSKICAREKEFAIFENLEKIDLKKIGGVIKVGEVFSHSLKFTPQKVYEFFAHEFTGKKGKSVFGISIFPENFATLRTLLVGSKKFLKNEGIASRFANKNFCNLSSAQSEFEILKKNGVEILAVHSKAGWWFAKFKSVQPFASYKFRDYEKTFRDARVGMLPPKLAQILVNLAVRDSKSLKIYDPFCGTGTVLTEAGLLGFENLGSDIDSRMVEFSQKNLAALNLQSDVFLHDAREKIQKKFDVVVSEGHLGPPRKTIPEPQVRAKIFEELKNLYENFFGWLDCRRVVICFPVYLENGVPKFFASSEILPAISKFGWQVRNTEKLIYSRENQTVGREIVVLER
ncbi:methyltransferase domain-containing protein [Candidatus Gracilibacteria bacterium]|nr:methyltransferase domain-containing protein [Candidatus Gracilibacteria bacterium]